MKVMIILSFYALMAVTIFTNISFAQESEEAHKDEQAGSHGGPMNPDIGMILNTKVLFSDYKKNPQRNKLYIEEAEIAFQSNLYPGIHGDFIIAMHQHEGEWEIHPEEAYVSFLDLPLGFQAVVGRKIVGFGRLNPIHPHHWKFAGRPLLLGNFFGTHPWFDDGAQLDWKVPNPWDIHLKAGFGAWSGETLTHHQYEEVDEGDEDHDHHWELGAKYDWSEFFYHIEPEEEEHRHIDADKEWGVSAFITYYFTHSMYLRPEYTHFVNRFNETENRIVIQLVWGLEPHAHRLED